MYPLYFSSLSVKKRIDFPPFEINVLKSIPEHTGLGSGTQLALSVGTVISTLTKHKISIDELAIILDRGKRSGIGIESSRKRLSYSNCISIIS